MLPPKQKPFGVFAPYTHKPIASPVMVGRTPELDRLIEALLLAEQGRGRCILISGEAGIGKSRLLGELCQRALLRQHRVVRGHCFEHDSSFPYAPWIDALRMLCIGTPPADVRQLLGPYAGELVKLLPELMLTLPDVLPTPSLGVEAEKRRMFETLTQFVSQMHGLQPVLVALEDLHWSDEVSLELFHFVARRVARLGILMVATYRSDQLTPQLAHLLAELNRERLADEITLAPLAREQVEEMVRAIFDIDQRVQMGFLDVLHSLTEGNPFFIEEVLKALVGAGEIFHGDGRWQRKPTAELHVPHSIQDAVQRQLAELSTATQRTLTLAALIGRRFDFPLLLELTHLPEDELVLHLGQLTAAQVLVETTANQFAFRHALTREGVYATLHVREREALHRVIGETLERFYAFTPAPSMAPAQAPTAGHAPAAHSAELSYHFYAAGMWDKVLLYGTRAGEQAQAMYALSEALIHYSHALDAAGHLRRAPPLNVLHARGQAYEILGEFEKALGDYERALDLARAEQNAPDEWQALLDLALLWTARDHARSGEYAQRALTLARTIGDPRLLGTTLNRLGNWHLNQQRIPEALQCHREAQQIFEELNDTRGIAATLELLSLTNELSGDMMQGTAYCRRALKLFRELADPLGIFYCLIHILFPQTVEISIAESGAPSQILAGGGEALELAHGLGFQQGEANVLGLLAQYHLQHGEYAQALERAQQGAAIAEGIDHLSTLTRLVWTLGKLYAELYTHDVAEEQCRRAIALARESGTLIFATHAVATLALIHIARGTRGELSSAEALLEGEPRADPPGGGWHERHAWFARARLALAQGNPERALQIIDLLLDSTANIEQFGARGIPLLAHARGDALSALRRWDEANSSFDDARIGAEEQGLRPLLWRIHLSTGLLCLAQKKRDDAEREFAEARGLIAVLSQTITDDALRDNYARHALAQIPEAPTRTARRAAKEAYGGLTSREREIAALVAQGKSNRALAKALVISETTAARHVANILTKLGFNSRAQIAAWAVERGLTQPPD